MRIQRQLLYDEVGIFRQLRKLKGASVLAQFFYWNLYWTAHRKEEIGAQEGFLLYELRSTKENTFRNNPFVKKIFPCPECLTRTFKQKGQVTCGCDKNEYKHQVTLNSPAIISTSILQTFVSLFRLFSFQIVRLHLITLQSQKLSLQDSKDRM